MILLFDILLNMRLVIIALLSCNLSFTTLSVEDQVRTRYEAEDDTFKNQAVDFIFDNIGYNFFSYNDAVINGKKWYELMRLRPLTDHRFLRDSLLRCISSSQPLKIGRDAVELDSAYICENIDMAFKVWREQPWGKNIDFDTFLEYILPYRIADEVPENWRKEYYDKYNPLLYEFRTSAEYDNEDPVEALKFLLGKLPYVYEPIYTSQAFMAFPHIGPEYVQYVTGSCREFSDFVIYVCRALGIPCAFNEAVNMHRGNNGHVWASFWNKNNEEYIISNYPPVLVPNRQDYTLGSSKCKVYRKTYSLNKEIYGRGRRNRRRLLPKFRFPTYEDVTATYTNRFIAELNIPIDSVFGKIKWNEPVYLCSPSRDKWLPEDFAFRTLSSLNFSNLQTGEVICLCIEKNSEMEPVCNPFYVDVYSHQLHFLNPLERSESVVLKSKYTVTADEQIFRDRMVGGVFEVSDNSDFSYSDTLCVISQAPDRKYTSVFINDDIVDDYRYVRYKGPDGGFCNVAEVTYYDTQGNLIQPMAIIGTPSHKSTHDYVNVYDGSTLTSFDYPEPYGGWSGIEINKGTRIGKIVYTPRNRDNFINEGDLYELQYFDGGWKCLGKQVAQSDTLVYTDVPDDALLLLKNHSRGVQERVFTYEDGSQLWR